jgi:hypothetical protein
MLDNLDQLAARVGLPVLLEDADENLVGYSTHSDRLDTVREETILNRRASSDVAQWLREVGVIDTMTPVRVPANASLQMLSRVCVPVRHRQRLLGYLWFVDPDGAIDDSVLEMCVQATDRFVEHLLDDRTGQRSRLPGIDEAARSVLLGNSGLTQAIRILEDEGFDPEQSYRVLVLGQGDRTEPPETSAALRDVLRSVHQAFENQRSRAVVLNGHGAILYRHTETGGRKDTVRQRLRTLVTDQGSQPALLIGCGAPSSGLMGVSVSYQQALTAVRIARTFGHLGPVVEWAELGMYRLVSELSAAGGSGADLLPAFAEISSNPYLQPLLETIEVYLDAAGQAQVAAARLSLHRTSLYYRIQRFEQLTGSDLKDGVQRTAIHLALKVARMSASGA